MSQRLVVIGGGGHARVVIEAARSRPDLWDVEGFYDLRPCEDTERLLNLPRLGMDDDLRTRVLNDGALWAVVGVGATSPASRRRLVAGRFEGTPLQWATLIHRAATVSETAQFGAGTVVMAGAVVNAGAQAGVHGVINTGAVVEHDVRLGAFVQVSPGAVIGGGAVVGENSYIGLGARIRDHVTVGREVLVGMGAVVVKDIKDGARVIGVPAREVPA